MKKKILNIISLIFSVFLIWLGIKELVSVFFNSKEWFLPVVGIVIFGLIFLFGILLLIKTIRNFISPNQELKDDGLRKAIKTTGILASIGVIIFIILSVGLFYLVIIGMKGFSS